jgi:hypothetical protein
MRWLSLIPPLVLLACATPLATGAASAPVVSADGGNDTAAKDQASAAERSDADFVARWLDAMTAQIQADARAGATRTFKDIGEANDFLYSLTPRGFHARPDYFASLAAGADDLDALAVRMASYVRGHPDEMDRRLTSFTDRLRPLLAEVMGNIVRQFPPQTTSRPGSWTRDPTAALAEAKTSRRPALLAFCAAWVRACLDVDRALSDAAVRKVLDARFVVAYIDMTDEDDPEVKKLGRRFGVAGLPLVVVVDAAGKEVAREANGLDAASLGALLARAR